MCVCVCVSRHRGWGRGGGGDQRGGRVWLLGAGARLGGEMARAMRVRSVEAMITEVRSL